LAGGDEEGALLLRAADSYYAETVALLDEVGLDGSERWETRLAIPKRAMNGGGLHFQPEELEVAAEAHFAFELISEFVSASRQLQAKMGEVHSVSASMAFAATDADAKLTRLSDVLGRVGATLDELFGTKYGAQKQRWLAAGLPVEALDSTARVLARDVLSVPWYAASVALEEFARADKEAARALRPLKLARALNIVRRARLLCAETREARRPSSRTDADARAGGGSSEPSLWPAELAGKEAELAQAEARLVAEAGSAVLATHDELDDAV